MNELALFAGAGGGILGGHLLGWRTVCAVEWDPYAASVLCARQNDGVLPTFPVWDDVRTFDGKPWRGIVDVVSGGFPCQDISSAGRGAGLDGERSGLWREMARVVGEVRPRFVFVENSPALTRRGGTRVIGDLAALGYDAQWDVMGAAHVGAPHQRDRIWIVAYSNDTRQRASAKDRSCGKQEKARHHFGGRCSHVSNPASKRQQEPRERGHSGHCQKNCRWKTGHAHNDGQWYAVEPDVGRVADGVAARMDRLKAIGNGQVSAVAAASFELLSGGINV